MTCTISDQGRALAAMIWPGTAKPAKAPAKRTRNISPETPDAAGQRQQEQLDKKTTASKRAPRKSAPKADPAETTVDASQEGGTR